MHREESARNRPKERPGPYYLAVHSIIRVMRRHHACIERRVADLDIHHSQHRLLLHLARFESIPSQKEIAETMGISPAAVAATLKRLEREGYIARSVPGEDNRRNEIRITEQGLRKVAESREIFESVDRATFAGFSEEEMNTLRGFLSRIDQNLDNAGAPTEPPATHRG